MRDRNKFLMCKDKQFICEWGRRERERARKSALLVVVTEKPRI